MEEQRIETKLGRIALGIDGPIGEEPIVFLHGIFIDRTLWADVDRSLTGRAHIYTDMPAHGRSSDVGHTWSLDDGAEMLIEVLDALEVERCVAIGHSWGSMTALHAASRFPSRFVALGLFNMPFRRVEGLNRLGFRLQKSAAIFPRFYARQAAKSLYTAPFLRKRPELAEAMQGAAGETASGGDRPHHRRGAPEGHRRDGPAGALGDPRAGRRRRGGTTWACLQGSRRGPFPAATSARTRRPKKRGRPSGGLLDWQTDAKPSAPMTTPATEPPRSAYAPA